MAGKFSVEAILRARDKFSRPIARIQTKLGRFTRSASRGISQASRVVDGMTAGIKRIGLAAAAAGASVGLLARNIIGAGAEFEQAIADVGAVGLQTRAQIKPLENEAKRLGATTKFTATEAAKAMEIMARAGFKNQEILSGVGGVLDAAAASGLEMAEVANHVSNVLKGMGLEASEATRVADVLALASSRTNSTIGSLGESMKNVASTARQLKVPLEDAVAGVALLQDVGLDASVAGSAMNTMLTKLAKPPAAVAAQMKEFGVSFKDAKGNMLPFAKVVENISEAARKSGGNMDRVAFLAELVGLRGQKAASNLADLFETGRLEDLTAELNKAQGAAGKMAAMKMDTLKGDFTLLNSAIDSVKVALFETESGPLRDIIKGMTEWVSANKDLIVGGFQDFMKSIRDNLPAIVQTLERVGRAAAIILGVATAIKVVTAATKLWTLALAANPVTLLIVGLTAAIALLFAFWPEVSAFFSRVWEGIKDIATRIAGAVGGFVQTVWGPVKSFLIGAFEFIVGALALLLQPFLPGLRVLFGMVQAAAQLIMSAWAPVSTFFGALWDGIKAAFTSAWELIVAAASRFFDAVKAVFSPIVDFFAGIWNSISEAFHSVFDGIVETISSVIGNIRKVGRLVLGSENAGDTEPARPGQRPSAEPRQVISPSERVSRTITESSTTTRGEITIRDESGRAQVTKQPKGPGIGIELQPSGAF